MAAGGKRKQVPMEAEDSTEIESVLTSNSALSSFNGLHGFDNLNEASDLIYGQILNIPTGALTYHDSLPMEEKIKLLQVENKFFDNELFKIALIDPRYTPTDHPEDFELKFTEQTNRNFEKSIHSKLIKSAILSTLLGEILTQPQNDEKTLKFRQNVIKQLKLSRNLSTSLDEFRTDLEKIVKENLELAQNIREKSAEYTEVLKDAKSTIEVHQQANSDKLATVEMRIKKTNLMRSVTLRLMAQFNLIEDDEELYESLRMPCTLDSLQSD